MIAIKTPPWRHAIALIALLGCAPAGEGGAREALLGLHEEILASHRDRDAERFTAVEAESTTTVSDGEVAIEARADRLAKRRRYFASTRFRIYRDLQPPRVEVSDDGTLGWVIANVEVIAAPAAAAEPAEESRTVWAWIELYRKAGSSWLLVGNVANRQP